MDENESTEDGRALKKAHRTWAAEKGMAERFLDPSGAFPVANPKYQEYAQARAFAGWADDLMVSEAVFDAAVIAASNLEFR
jgi:hypothetical protein